MFHKKDDKEEEQIEKRDRLFPSPPLFINIEEHGKEQRR